MTTLGRSAVPEQRVASRGGEPADDVRLEPLPHLEWSLATEAPTESPAPPATSPATLRRAWIHQAPEDRVLRLYRQLNGTTGRLPAPWWLPALDRGELPSRAAAFAIEDEVHAVLAERAGWVFVPWGTGGTGYWEYGPSDREPAKVPTTVLLTDAHPGWIEAVPAYADTPGVPVPMAGASALLQALPQIESWGFRQVGA